ncbi:MAG: hypothetical protein WBV59_13320 [Anaerolineae bacterium]
MNGKRRTWLLRLGWALGLLALAIGYWLIPIRGQVTFSSQTGPWDEPWPRWRVNPSTPQAGEALTVQVTDLVAWPNVLATVNGRPISVQPWGDGRLGRFTWAFVFPAPADDALEIVFYSHCDSGCQERSTLRLGKQPGAPTPGEARPASQLCAVAASPTRDWHGRSGWDVEMTYASLADERHWGIDDLAWRVQQATANGLHVLVRVDYDQEQTLPATDDQAALTGYLDYLRRLARDARLAGVYGYVLGSGFNQASSNAQANGRPVTPAWVARLLDGYGEDPSHTDNAVQIIRAEHPGVRVLVGPVRPWSTDQDSDRRAAIDAPWLNTMNALVAALDEGAQAKLAAGYALVAPDGFALHVAGRVGELGAAEPSTDQRRPAWNGAQAGFRVYRDWLDIINAYATTRGLPVYITATNTFVTDEGVPPAQNYPTGWLTAALAEISREPQVQALCWFLDEDRSGDPRWDLFSLTRQPGQLAAAAAEFDALLRGNSTP